MARFNEEKDRERVYELYETERLMYDQGLDFIAGVDEVGRGPLVGPVCAGAVILPFNFYIPRLNDSKKVSKAHREEIYEIIKENAISYAVSFVDREVIDRINIFQANILAMKQALNSLEYQPEVVLVDAVELKNLPYPSMSIIGGDELSASIAAASIMAKVERDRCMEKLHEQYPQYNFIKNNGYGTKEHLEALKEYSPCPEHRRSFEPIKSKYMSYFR